MIGTTMCRFSWPPLASLAIIVIEIASGRRPASRPLHSETHPAGLWFEPQSKYSKEKLIEILEDRRHNFIVAIKYAPRLGSSPTVLLFALDQ